MNESVDSENDKRDKWLEDTRAELYHRMDALEQAQRDVDARLDKLEKSVEKSLASVHSCIDDLLTNLNKDDKEEEKDMPPLSPVEIKKEPEDTTSEDVKTSPIVLAAQAGDLAAVKDLVLTGALAIEQNEKGESTLEIAAAAGYVEVVRLLLDHSYNFAQDEEPSAQKRKHVEEALLVAKNSAVAKLLVEKIGPNAAMATMHRAAQEGRVTALRELLSSGVGANEADGKGWCALHYSADAGHSDCVGVLLEFKAANGYVGGPKLQTPLHLAAEKGHNQCLDLLLRGGSHCINVRDRHGYTALSYAASGTFAECVKVLLSHGAKANLSNTKGETPLHKAACLTSSEQNNEEQAASAAAQRKQILKMLLDGGAKPHTWCEDGKTAFDQDGADALKEVMS